MNRLNISNIYSERKNTGKNPTMIARTKINRRNCIYNRNFLPPFAIK